MSTLPLFPHLPPLIIRLIFDYVGDGTGIDTGRFTILVKPLLWVCSNIRAIVLPLYCNDFFLDLAGTPVHEQKRRFRYSDYPDIGYQTHGLATNLDINIDEWNIYTGEALRKLTMAPYSGYDFPMARSLRFIFVSYCLDENGRPHSLDVEHSITAFVRQIKQLAPMVNSITIFYHLQIIPFGFTRYFGDLVSQLFQLATRVDYNYHFDSDEPIQLRLDLIRNLVSMSFTVDGYTCSSIQLARQNAPTLQNLVLRSDFPADLAGLIQSPNGSYVTYPCLRTLKLSDDADDDVPERVIFKGVVPFPSLRHIRLLSCYPFGDDVLFRGNSSTLEHLELFVSDLLVSIIIDYHVFTSTSHPKLRQIHTQYPVDEFPSQFATPADTLRFMLSIGSKAPVRSIIGDHSSSELVPALALDLNCASIQYLDLPHSHLDLLDIIALVKVLPALFSLHTALPVFGLILDHVDRDKLPAFITATYAPLGRRFRYGHYRNYPAPSLVEAAPCMLLLALVYPNYTYSDRRWADTKGFMDEIEAAVALDMFKPYAPRLQAFLQRIMKSL
ncbi:hypothetical protein GGI08_001754 [Coemansia sp. S2]|nr:hypothetical protein GGI08_001754 [Coemansia sp. S2]